MPMSSTHFAGMEEIMLIFLANQNNYFQDKKGSTCKIQTIPVLGKSFPSQNLSSASFWVLHVHSPQK